MIDIMFWGPKIIAGGLLVTTIYNAWQRNVIKTAACGMACIAAFVLGW